jgi:hypothetical protein
MPNAYYSSSIVDFLKARPDEVLGTMARSSTFPIEPPQMAAWIEGISILHQCLGGLNGWLHLEFAVPRIGSRIDAVVIVQDTIFVVEFKAGEKVFKRQDYNQAWD